MRAAKEWCPNDKLRRVINMSGIFTHHKALAAKRKKEENQQFEVIICSVKVRRRDCGSDWPPRHLATVSWKEPEVQTITSAPRLWPVILEGRERCPTITATPSTEVAYCSVHRSGCNPRLADRATLSLPWVCAFPKRARSHGSTCLFASEERVSAEQRVISLLAQWVRV